MARQGTRGFYGSQKTYQLAHLQTDSWKENLQQMEQQEWKGGVPTAPDVEELIKQLGVLQMGDAIPYELVETIISVRPKTSRWRAVTNSWRRRILREYNLIVACQDQSFVVYDNSQRLTHGVKRITAGVKTIRKGSAVVAGCTTAKLNNEEQKVQMHYTRIAAQLDTVMKQQAELKEPIPPSPVKQLTPSQ